MKQFNFLNEIRDWLYLAHPIGEVCIYWCQWEFRLYQPFDNHWAAEDIVTRAKLLIT